MSRFARPLSNVSALAIVASALALSHEAHAQVISKIASFTLSGTDIVMSVKYDEAIDAAVERKVLTGLTTTIVSRFYLYESGTTSAILIALKKCMISYDVWNQVFFIQLTQPGVKANLPVANFVGVRKRCTQVDFFPLIDQSKLTVGTKYFVRGIVEVNPADPQMVARISKWISRPAGASSLGPSDALFGSFVGLFASNIAQVDKTITFNTQEFKPEDVKAPAPPPAPPAASATVAPAPPPPPPSPPPTP